LRCRAGTPLCCRHCRCHLPLQLPALARHCCLRLRLHCACAHLLNCDTDSRIAPSAMTMKRHWPRELQSARNSRAEARGGARAPGLGEATLVAAWQSRGRWNGLTPLCIIFARCRSLPAAPAAELATEGRGTRWTRQLVLGWGLLRWWEIACASVWPSSPFVVALLCACPPASTAAHAPVCSRLRAKLAPQHARPNTPAAAIAAAAVARRTAAPSPTENAPSQVRCP
jgi:hypothetical protein